MVHPARSVEVIEEVFRMADERSPLGRVAVPVDAAEAGVASEREPASA